MKNLAIKGREQIVHEQTNQLTKTKINESKTKCRFPNVPFVKHTQSYMQMQFFIFSFFNVMNAKKKLSALDQ